MEPESQNALTVLPFSTPVGLELPPDFSIVAWAGYARVYAVWETAGQFFLGDLMLHAENKGADFYNEAIQIAADLRLAPKTLKNCMFIAKRFPKAVRRPGVDYSLYREVAGLSDDEALPLIDMAVEKEWTRRELGAEVKRRKTKDEVVEIDGECIGLTAPAISDEAFQPSPVSLPNPPGGFIQNLKLFFDDQDLHELSEALDRGEQASALEVRRLITDHHMLRDMITRVYTEVQAICESEAEMGAEDIEHLTRIAEIIEGLGVKDEANSNGDSSLLTD